MPVSLTTFSRLMLTVACLLVGAVLVAADPAPAAKSADLQKKVDAVKAQQKATSDKIVDVEKKAQELLKAIEALKLQKADQDKLVEQAEKELNDHLAAIKKKTDDEQKVAQLEKAAAEAQARQTAAAKTLDEKKGVLKTAETKVAGLKTEQSKADATVKQADAELAKQVAAQKAALAAKDQAATEAAAAQKAVEEAAIKAKAAADKAAATAKALADAQAVIAKTEAMKKAAADTIAKAPAAIGAAETELAAARAVVAQSQDQLALVTRETVEKQKAAEGMLISLGRLVSFSHKVAPVFAKRCLACHNARTAKGRLNMETFTGLMKGGESGDVVAAGKSDESTLLSLLEDGTMPQDADPLTADEIAVIKKWIDTAARLDAGFDPSAPLIEIAPKMPQPMPPQAYRVPLPVTAMAFSPDGTLLATSGYHEVLIYNAADGKQVRRITNVAERVYDIHFSADGKSIVVAAGTPAQIGEAKRFNVADGALLGDYGRSADSIFAAVLSPDGKRLATGGADRAIRIFDVASQQQQLVVEDHADWVMGLAWSPDGSKLASASRDKTSKIFDTKTGDSLVTFNGHGEPVFGVAFSPDGAQVVTGGRDKNIRVWNVADAKEVRAIGGFGDEVFKVAVTADGRIFSSSADKTVRLHQLADGKEVRKFEGNADWVYTVAFAPTTKVLASGAFNGEVKLWQVDDGKQLVAYTAAPGYPQATATAAK